MIYSEELLEQADHLARRDQQRPRQSNLRRSVSSSYYALFHFVTWEASRLIGPNLEADGLVKLQRWFDHGEMKKVCGMFSGPNAPKNIAVILGRPVSASLQSFSQAFIKLQEARHSADYDMSSTWTRLTAPQFLETAREAIESWPQLRRTHEANVFAIALMSAKLFDSDR